MIVDIPEERIVGLGMEDNFWEMGLTGPCGPCTEIHYSPRGGNSIDTCTEIWNLVFMQYDRDITGHLSPLHVGHVDTGLGLERITAVLNNVYTRDYTPDVFRTDVLSPIINHISTVTGADAYTSDYSQSSKLDFGYRVLADHIR